MNTQRNLSRGALVLVGLVAWLVPWAAASDEGQAAAEQVSAAIYQDYMNLYLYTHTGHNRGVNGPHHDPARDNIVALFESYGLSTELDYFSGGENVVATQLGTLYPERIYIIGGHYDSVNNPGADDNASGVAATLEIARILSQYESESTIVYIAFDAEETGLNGSDHYATEHADDDIRGMISLDMVCYDPNTNHALIYGTTASSPIKSALAAAINEYSNLTYTIQGGLDASDHAPFEWQGFQACLLIEGEVWNNPNYHTQNDKYETPNYLNFPYAAQMTRAVIGWLVDAAGVAVSLDKLVFSYPEGLPEYARPNGTTMARVEVTGVGNKVPQPGTGLFHYRVENGDWVTVPMTEIGPNVYDAVFPAGDCRSTLAYYFSAQATDGEWFTDPRHAPVTTFTATFAYNRQNVYEYALDADPGWAISGGQWAFGHPTGGGGGLHGFPDPNNGATGVNVFGVNLNGNYSTEIGGPYYVTTGPMDLSGYVDTKLKFKRWLNTDYIPYVSAKIEASNDGVTWTQIWSNANVAIKDNVWSDQEYDVATIADNQPTVYIRWSYAILKGGAYAYSGWNIDDICVTGLECQAPVLVGDLNCDGFVDFGDINPFVMRLSDPAAYAAAFPECPDDNGDINGSGSVGFDDINPFVALVSGGI